MRSRSRQRTARYLRALPIPVIGLLLFASPATAPPPSVAATPEPAASTLRCFGAASMDPQRLCRNSALRSMVVPTPTVARELPGSPCEPLADGRELDACSFGAPRERARATIALVGDSHAMHWRAAVDHLANAKDWFGVSIALGGCPYSTATRDIWEPLLSQCAARNRGVPGWFERHPEVDTVFVAQIAGVRWILPRGQSQFEGQVRNYMQAWRKLPATVRRIVVLRDTPQATKRTRGCIQRAMAAGVPAGPACRVPRDVALPPDPAVEAARRIGGPRMRVLNLTDYFCDDSWCYPVIGGALVQKDWNHLTPVFMATVGPYLLRHAGAALN